MVTGQSEGQPDGREIAFRQYRLSPSLQIVTVGFDHRPRLVAPEVLHQSSGGRLVFAMGEDHRVLADGHVQAGGHHPGRTAGQLAFLVEHLGQGDGAQFGVAVAIN